MNKFIWISSYPKSGNTWVRYLIANYFYNKAKKFDAKVISSIKYFPIPSVIQKLVNKDELIKDPYNIAKYWIKSQEITNINNGNIAFLKNHNALIRLNDCELTNENLSLAAIYIVRDPRDVVVSYANYLGITYDKTIEHLCSNDLRYNIELDDTGFPRIEVIGSWKLNYISWRDGIPQIPRIIIKYEDLTNNTYNTFYKILNFLSKIMNFKIDVDQINIALENSNFKILKKTEKNIGFFENEGKSIFFRNGKVGESKKKLNKKQILHIEKVFSDEMKILDYF